MTKGVVFFSFNGVVVIAPGFSKNGKKPKLCVYRWDIVGVKVVSAIYHTTLRKELRNERFLSLCRTEKKILQSAIYCF